MRVGENIVDLLKPNTNNINAMQQVAGFLLESASYIGKLSPVAVSVQPSIFTHSHISLALLVYTHLLGYARLLTLYPLSKVCPWRAIPRRTVSPLDYAGESYAEQRFQG